MIWSSIKGPGCIVDPHTKNLDMLCIVVFTDVDGLQSISSSGNGRTPVICIRCRDVEVESSIQGGRSKVMEVLGYQLQTEEIICTHLNYVSPGARDDLRGLTYSMILSSVSKGRSESFNVAGVHPLTRCRFGAGSRALSAGLALCTAMTRCITSKYYYLVEKFVGFVERG